MVEQLKSQAAPIDLEPDYDEVQDEVQDDTHEPVSMPSNAHGRCISIDPPPDPLFSYVLKRVTRFVCYVFYF